MDGGFNFCGTRLFYYFISFTDGEKDAAVGKRDRSHIITCANFVFFLNNFIYLLIFGVFFCFGKLSTYV
jgi:hypothetical protein